MKKVIIIVAVVAVAFTAIGMKIAEMIQPTEAEIRAAIRMEQNRIERLTQMEERLK